MINDQELKIELGRLQTALLIRDGQITSLRDVDRANVKEIERLRDWQATLTSVLSPLGSGLKFSEAVKIARQWRKKINETQKRIEEFRDYINTRQTQFEQNVSEFDLRESRIYKDGQEFEASLAADEFARLFPVDGE